MQTISTCKGCNALTLVAKHISKNSLSLTFRRQNARPSENNVAFQGRLLWLYATAKMAAPTAENAVVVTAAADRKFYDSSSTGRSIYISRPVWDIINIIGGLRQDFFPSFLDVIEIHWWSHLIYTVVDLDYYKSAVTEPLPWRRGFLRRVFSSLNHCTRTYAVVNTRYYCKLGDPSVYTRCCLFTLDQYRYESTWYSIVHCCVPHSTKLKAFGNFFKIQSR